MGDYITWADKLRKEYDAAIRLLRQRPFLATTTVTLCLLSLIFWACYSFYGLNQKQNKIDQLEGDISKLQDELKTLKADYGRQQEIVAPVLLRAAREFPGEEINDSLKKLVERLDATSIGRQVLRSAQATVDLKVSDSDKQRTTFLFGAYVALGKGNDSLLMMNSESYVVRPKATNEVIYAAETRADTTDLPQDRKASFLSNAEYVQFSFGKLPENCVVIGGTVTITLNSTATLKLDIPPQRARGKLVFIPDIQSRMKQFLD